MKWLAFRGSVGLVVGSVVLIWLISARVARERTEMDTDVVLVETPTYHSNREGDDPHLHRDDPDTEGGGSEEEEDGPDLEEDGPDLEEDGPDLEEDGPDSEEDGPDSEEDDSAVDAGASQSDESDDTPPPSSAETVIRGEYHIPIVVEFYTDDLITYIHVVIIPY